MDGKGRSFFFSFEVPDYCIAHGPSLSGGHVRSLSCSVGSLIHAHNRYTIKAHALVLHHKPPCFVPDSSPLPLSVAGQGL